MKSNNKNGLANLTRKATAVFGAALSALTGVDSNAIISTQNEDFESNTIQLKEIGKIKPMPVLKLNIDNPANSQFVARDRKSVV